MFTPKPFIVPLRARSVKIIHSAEKKNYIVVDSIFENVSRVKQIHNNSQTDRKQQQQPKKTTHGPIRFAFLSLILSSPARCSSCVIQVSQTRGGPSKSASRWPISAGCIANEVGEATLGGATASDPTHRSFVISKFIMAPEWQQDSSNVIIDQTLHALVLW